MNNTKSGSFSPFKSKAFSLIWIATVLSNIGTRMHEIAAGWLMTSLSTDPLMVALVQSASTLPIFLFSLLAGAVADIVSKRALLIVTQVMMAAVAAILTYTVFIGSITPWMLLIFVFVLGTGAAFAAPAKQSIVPLLVPKEDMQSAIALNSAGFNLSRAIGPAIAGIVIVSLGMAVPFAFNSISFLVIIGAFLWWHPRRAKHKLPSEHVPRAMIVGLRYAYYNTQLRETLWRVFAFFISVSAFWSLLPLVVKTELNGDARFFGILVGSIGLGAFIGTFLLPHIKKNAKPEQVIAISCLLLALIFILVASLKIQLLVVFCCLVFGSCWICVLSTLNVSAQLSLPDWVRARGLSIYLMVFFGSMSAGSIMWGTLASYIGISQTLLVSSITLISGVFLTRKLTLSQGQPTDFSHSTHWTEPVVVVCSENEKKHINERSPVMVTVEYNINRVDTERFLSLMQQLGQKRRQYGAYSWDVLEESDHPGVYIEYFLDVSWLEHLRHHERVTNKDRELQKQIRELHIGEHPPKVRHFFGPSPKIKKKGQ